MSDAALTNSSAVVAKIVDAYTIVINRGREHGVKEGAKFLIYGIGEEVVDPESNVSLGNLELVRGIGVVVHVQDKLSTIKSSRTQSPTPTIRTIKRNSRGFNAILGYGDETVEERTGDPVPVAFQGVATGDRARPI
jgi:hypothetical protein